MNGLLSSWSDAWRDGATRQFDELRRIPRAQLGDLVGGISVAMVLIPQSLAYADLAGLPPFIGLFASGLPLIVFSLLASSPYLQTGPVALTSLLTFGALTSAGAQPGTDAYVALAGVLAVVVGVVRFVLGGLRLGSIVYLMAEPVMIGFTSGAGLVIVSSQLPKALGATLDPEVAEWDNPILRAAWALVHPDRWEAEAVAIAVVTLVLMLGGRYVHRLFPGVLVAVVVAILYSSATGYEGSVVGDIDAGLPPLSLDLPWGELGSVIVGGIVIALVGFAEPASIARTFANEEHERWSSSREFLASGLANIAAGISGAFPVGGSFSRSSVNRFAGARTRWSGMITGAVILCFLPFAGALADLPQAVLGAIVVGAVYTLIRPVRLIRLWTRSPWQAGLAWATFLATLLTPPQVQWAVVIGVGLTFVLHVVRRLRLDAAVADDGSLSLHARGLLWMGSTSALESSLRAAIEADDGDGPVVLDLGEAVAIDGRIAESIATGREAAAPRSFAVANAPPGAERLLESHGIVLTPS